MVNIKKSSVLSCEIKADACRVIHKVTGKKIKRSHYGNMSILETEEGRSELIKAINAGNPYNACRFGTTEGTALYEYLKIAVGLKKDYSDYHRNSIKTLSGFFPIDSDSLNRWAEETIDYCETVDMLGVMNFRGEECLVRNYCKKATLLPVGALGSARNGWAYCLEGKKVLVVHPFTETIQSQYKRREQIFPGTNALPKFDLKTVKSVVSFAGQHDNRFSSWFEAKDYMIDQIDKNDYDVALLGCGAYGFHLAAHIKLSGKIAIHMGGSLQTLFGIKGKRWDNDPYMRSLYNDAWVYPNDSERPKEFKSVENGCYW